MNNDKKSSQVAGTTSEERLKILLKSVETDRLEFSKLLGKKRYEQILLELQEVLANNGLNEFERYYMTNHLSQICQLERVYP